MKKIIILGTDGQIGSYLYGKLSKNFSIIGTSRRENSTHFHVDFADRKSIINFLKGNAIDNIYAVINCYGLQQPIQNFVNTNFDTWEENITINFNNYSFFLHHLINSQIHSLRKILSFSGGGATGSRKSFSAYAVSKISIYKLSEILADELKEFNIDVNVIAPGVISSKMTKEIVNEGSNLGDEYNKALDTLKNGGDNLDSVFELCNFLLSNESNGISGKLISAQWDSFDVIKKLLKNEKNLFSLRRIDNKYFYENKEVE